MKYSIACVLAAAAIGVNAQGIAAGSLPAPGALPAGCMASGTGSYEVTIVKPAASAKRSLEQRQSTACDSNALIVTLSDGVLTDSKGRIGGIVANRQFQFDGPPSQTGTLYNGNFGFCGNNSLAIGPTMDFYQCLSGSFYNLYDQPSESNCSLVNLQVTQCTANMGAGSSASSAPNSMMSSAPVSQQSDGQPTATSAVVSQTTDGQPQAPSAVQTGAAAPFIASGAVAAVGAVAAFFL